jgi:phospholipase/lecithinase/hemolysin
VPDLGLTPFALAENTTTGDTGRATLLTDLTTAFNNRMSVELVNDGRLIGLVYADVEIQSEAKFPPAYGYTDVVNAACLASAPLPGCTTATLVSGATSTNNLWADTLMPGPNFHGRLGSIAAFRARNNPF